MELELIVHGPVKRSEYGKMTWDITNIGDCAKRTGNANGSATYDNTSDKWDLKTGGNALKVNLPDPIPGGCSAKINKNITITMYYDIIPIGNSTPKVVDAYGQYSHQKVIFTLNPSITLSGADFNIAPAIKFEEHKNTHAQLIR